MNYGRQFPGKFFKTGAYTVCMRKSIRLVMDMGTDIDDYIFGGFDPGPSER